MVNWLNKTTHKIFAVLKRFNAKVVAVCLAGLMLFASVLTVKVLSNVVYINDDGKTVVAYTMMENPTEILKSNGITVGGDDILEFTGFNDGEGNITIKRAFPITVVADGETHEVMCADKSVAEAIALAGVTLGENDIVNYDLNELCQPQMQVVVQRVAYQEQTLQEEIPFTSRTEYSYQVKKGKSQVKTEGVKGIKETKIVQTLIDGVVTNEEVISEEVVSQPVEEVILAGVSPNTPVSILDPPADFTLDENGKPANYTKVIQNAVSVAYSARKGAKTASGRTAVPGMVAVNPKVIPYGTRLYITSPDNRYVYGYAIAADTGTALTQGIVDVDLFFDSYQGSCQWGKKMVNIYILN